jgi:3-hydroxymyristoyl/3-hydroxydecanoyl-(acyl carrier protein) dehydratase
VRWRFLDAIDELVPDRSASGRITFPVQTPFFADHFPGFPVVPGVVLLEALAQLSGKLIGYSVRAARGDWPFPILSMANGVKFRRFVRPEEEVRLESRLEALREESAVVHVRGWVAGRMTTQAEQLFVFNAVPLASAEERERLERLERAELRRLWRGYPE